MESDPKVCRERPKGKEKSASPSRVRRGVDIWKAPKGPGATRMWEAFSPCGVLSGGGFVERRERAEGAVTTPTLR